MSTPAAKSTQDALRRACVRARREMKRTQRQFAELLEVHPLTVSRWETGNIAITIEALEAISGATGKPLGWFFQELSGSSENPGTVRQALTAVQKARKALEEAEHGLAMLLKGMEEAQ